MMSAYLEHLALTRRDLTPEKITQEEYIASIAISLKRIANALEDMNSLKCPLS